MGDPPPEVGLLFAVSIPSSLPSKFQSSRRHHDHFMGYQSVVGRCGRKHLVLGGLLVDIGLGVVLGLVELVADGILGGGGTEREC